MAILTGFLGALTQFLGFFVMLAGAATSTLLQLSVSMLNLVLSPNFISLSYTDPTGNPFLATGWELTRGLTNIIFVIALIAIGVGTALRKTGYQAQKALPLLLIIALLINFSPVLLGLVVDATNIVMNYFLSAGVASGNIIANQSSAVWGTWTSGFGSDFFNPSSQVGRFVGLGVIVLFNILGAFIFFIFSFLFIMRYIAIWLLVILSPIAFASYILPATRRFWTAWWKQFTQWSVVGMTAAFFIYLSDQIIKLALLDKAIVSGGSERDGLGILDFALPWGIAIAFLFLGLTMALSTSAMGSGFVMGLAQKTKGAAGRLAKVTTYDKFMARQAAKGDKSIFNKMALLEGQKTKGWKKPFGWAAKVTGVEAGLRATGRAGIREGTKIQAQAVDSAKKGLEDFVKTKNWAGLAAQASTVASDAKKVAIADILGEKGQANKLNEVQAKTAASLSRKYFPQHLPNIISASDPYGLSKDKNIQATMLDNDKLRKLSVELSPEQKREIIKDSLLAEKGFEGLSEKEKKETVGMINNMKEDELNNQLVTDRITRAYLVRKSIIEKSPKESFNDDFFNDPLARKLFINTRSPDAFSQALNNVSQSTAEKLYGSIQDQVQTVDGLLSLSKNNERLLRYMASQAGRLGIKPISVDIKGTKFASVGDSLGDIDTKEKMTSLARLIKAELEERRKKAPPSGPVGPATEPPTPRPTPQPRGAPGVSKPKNPPRGQRGVSKPEKPPRGQKGVGG